MPVVGFSFTKFSAERNSAAQGKLKINNNISIKEVQKKELTFGNKPQPGLQFMMALVVSYLDEKDTKVGELIINGDVFFVEEEKTVKDILESWKKRKNIDKKTMQQVLGASYNRSNIQAVVLSRDVGLPPPIRLPSIEFK